MHSDILIVGAGHAGAQCAIALRQAGFSGSIAIVGMEPELPYERPPLSKEYFAGEKSFERLLIRPPEFWVERDVHFLTGLEVISIDPAAKQVRLNDGTGRTYGQLVWAAGGRARAFNCPGAELDGIHTMRSRADCDGILRDLADGARSIVIIGGGYIGLEAAAVLTKMSCHVTLLEALPRILARVAGPELSEFYEAEHRAHGVDLRTGVIVRGLTGAGRVSGVELADGTVIKADAVIVGIGIEPCLEPLAVAGAATDQGVLVDDYCRTTLPDIFAVGDCARFACTFADGHVMRVESVQNANDQAICVAKTICGDAQPYRAFPWFWSNQYDLRLQTAGISLGYDRAVLRGDPGVRSFSVVYLRDGRVIALDCVNAVKDYVQGRKLIEQRQIVDPELVSDSAVALKDLLGRS